MTPGPRETADGMTLGKIERIIDACVTSAIAAARPAHYIAKKAGRSGRLDCRRGRISCVGEVVRLLLDAYYEPQFSDHSHGFRPGRGCHTALRELAITWTGRPGSSRVISPAAWSHRHTAFAFMGVVSNRAGFGVWDQYSQAFSASVADVEGLQLAALDTLQHGLAGDAESVASRRSIGTYPGGRVVDEQWRGARR